MRSRLLRELFVCGGRWGVKGLNWSRLASPQAPKRHSWCQIATASTCNSAAVYLVRTGEDFKQRSPDGGAREEQRNLLRIKSDGLLLPSNRARRHRGSSSACIIQCPARAEQPRCQKAALKPHILLQRRHTSPSDAPDTLQILPQACCLTPPCRRHVSHQHRDWTQISYDFTAFSAKTQSLQM